MNTDYTHITLVLDRSGSMASCWNETMGGLKHLIADQKKEDGKCTFSFYNFDTVVEKTLDFADIQVVSENVEDFKISPRGFTALYDAIGRAIRETGESLAALPEKERAGKVLFIIQTDGQENASKEFSASSVKKLIDEQTEKYNWVFNFIGADEKSVLEAQSHLGFKGSNTSYYSTHNTLDTFSLLSEKLKSTRGADMVTYASSMSFTDAEKAEIGK
jgi:pantothenate kinase